MPGRSRAPASAKLLIVDVIAEHDIETHKELTSEGDFRLGPAAPLQDGEVATPKIVIRTRGQRGRLAQDPAEERIPLFGDLAEVLFVGRGIDRRGQADVTDDMLAVREAGDGPQNEDRGQGGQGADPRMREQPSRLRMGVDDTFDLRVELVDPAVIHASSSRLSSRRRVVCGGRARARS